MSETRTGSASPKPRLRAKRPPSPQATTCVSLSLSSPSIVSLVFPAHGPPNYAVCLAVGSASLFFLDHTTAYFLILFLFLSSFLPVLLSSFHPLLSFNPIASFFLPFYLLVLGTPPPYLGSCLGSGDRTWDRLSVGRCDILLSPPLLFPPLHSVQSPAPPFQTRHRIKSGPFASRR